MIKKLQSIVENIFLNAEQKQMIIKTSKKHNDAIGIFRRSLDEVSRLYRIDEFYDLKEKVSENGDVTKYIFSRLKWDETEILSESFRNNTGTLVLVDEETKREINKKFRYEMPRDVFSFKEEILEQCPDFIYKFDGMSFWVNLKEIRNNEAEVEHTKYLELLYRALFQAEEIEIDTDFSRYSNTTHETWYFLKHFRLERNSLHLVMEYKESRDLIAHTFNKIQSIKCHDNGTRLKFWLYMDEGTYRFYIPYTTNKLNGVPLDPIIYKIF